MVGRGLRYEQYIDINGNQRSTCHTHEAMVQDPRYLDPYHPHKVPKHNFLPCKDYWRTDDGKPNVDICMPIRRGYVGRKDIKKLKSISTSSKISFSPVGHRYTIKDPKADKCEKYWKRAENSLKNLETKTKIDIDGDAFDGQVDRILVKESPFGKDSSGGNVMCYNFQKLAAGGICRTDSIEYPWGFCGPSCHVPSNFSLLDGIEENRITFEKIKAKYYDGTGYNKYTGHQLLPDHFRSRKNKFLSLNVTIYAYDISSHDIHVVFFCSLGGKVL